MRLGVHMGLKGGFAANVKRVASIGCKTVQIFAGNPTGWKMGKADPGELEKRAALLKDAGIEPLVVHSAYLINLATANEEFLGKSKKLLDETIQRAAVYKAPYVVLHTGNHGGQGVEKGIGQIVESIAEGLAGWPPGVKLLLENTAGSGTALGSKFEELAAVLQSFPAGTLGICFDTAHGWAAGHGLDSPGAVEKTLAHLDRTVGLEHLLAIHVNDTKVELGARVDRHAHIGAGAITLQGFGALLNYGWPEELPVILETPENGTDFDRINMESLQKLIV